MTENNLVLELPAEHLLDKWGFGDGDCCDDLLTEWVAKSRWKDRFGDEETGYNTDLGYYLNSRVLLTELVMEHLKPSLPPRVANMLRRVLTAHNPITVDDDDVSLHQQLRQVPPARITQAMIDTACERAFPDRTDGWLRMFASLRATIGLHAELTRKYPKTALLQGEIHHVLRVVVDDLAMQWSEDELALAAELLAPDRMVSAEELQMKHLLDFLATARRALL